MTEAKTPALLPTGLRDLLPPEAGAEATLAEALLTRFAAQGYERVKPPLVEFEESMLSGAGAGLADQTFRLMDPASHRMMAVRSDLTPQIARIAASRLSRSPRPLRLSYAGEILRVRGGELRPERQFRQVGFELIGIGAGAACDAEVILLAADALHGLGLEGGLSVDLNAPTLVASLIAEAGLDAERADHLRDALDRKDAVAVEGIGGEVAGAAGAALADHGRGRDRARLRWRGSRCPASAAIGAGPAAGGGGAAARGRRPRSRSPSIPSSGAASSTTPAPASACSRAACAPSSAAAAATRWATPARRGRRPPAAPSTSTRCFAPRPRRPRRATSTCRMARREADGAGLRDAGWVTIAGLAPEADPAAEAARLGCSHLWQGGTARAHRRERD